MKKIILLFVFCVWVTTLSYSENLNDYLVPSPQKITYFKHALPHHHPTEDLMALQSFLHSLLKENMDSLQNEKVMNGIFSLHFIIDDDLLPQQYRLVVHDKKIELAGGDRTALYYAKITLCQLIEYSVSENQPLPAVEIVDYPNFERRGYMLDISRNKVPTMETLYGIVDMLTAWKINELQLYTEHTFAYRNHADVWKDCSPMTAAEIRQLDSYCKKRFIDLVPNQNSFGHMENWLRHDSYLPLAECPEDCKTKWGMRNRTSLDPTNPQSLALMKELYEELLPNFSSAFFNIGCDETVELGLGNSKALCDSVGAGTVYLQYLVSLNEEVNRLGKQAQFWGDIIENHPELVEQVPSNMIAMAWGYDRDTKFDKKLAIYSQSKLAYYVCPGTATWRSLIGRISTSFQNIYNAANAGVAYNAKGFLLTDWGDYGHWQPLSVSYPPLLYGAGCAWNCDTSAKERVAFQLNHYIFHDTTGNTANALMKLGNAYLLTNIPEGVANAFHLMLHRHKWTMKGNYQTKELNYKGLQNAESEINDALILLDQAEPHCPDSAILVDELWQAARLAKHGIHLGFARLNAKDNATENIPLAQRRLLADDLTLLIDNQRSLWTVRNRVGGMEESIAKLQEILDNYLQKGQ